VLSIALARPGRFARLALALLAAAGISSCGSGAVSGPGPVTDPNRITVLPDIATLYSGLPTTFVISGGTGSYIVSSSNQAIVQVSGSMPGSLLTVIPNPVLTDTPVTLTVRDTGATPTASATLTVRPNTVANSITITPSSTQGGSCAPAICSGGDAEVSVTISQGGIPLAARGVTFSLIAGSFRFITSPPGQTLEDLDTSVTVHTDETGKARARLRVLAGAPNQTALLRITDIGTGAYRETSFTIAQATGTSPGFFATPDSIVFSGLNEDVCATGVEADVYVFGGLPPYAITNVGTPFTISRGFIPASGGSFTVRPTGFCVAEPGLPITIADSSGRTTVVNVANVLGTRAVPALVVAPVTVSLDSCNAVASVSVAGGLGPGTYVVNSGSGALLARMVSGNTLTIQRVPRTAASTPVSVGVTSGNAGASIAVTLTGEALNTICDGSTLAVAPATVTLTGCSPSGVDVTISGGTGLYAATSDNGSVSAFFTGPNTLRIERAPSVGFTPPATVTVTDSAATPASRSITVNANGAGLGACP